MNKIALFLNYDRLGGAEKSGLEQRELIGKQYVDLFVPMINKKSEIEEGTSFVMPKQFFKASRSSSNNYFKILLSLIKWLVTSKKVKIKNYEKIWFNGLKVFLLYIPIIYKTGYKGEIYFHLRDYISDSKIILIAFKLLGRFRLNIIANSKDVGEDFQNKYGHLNLPLHVCYNPYVKMSAAKKTRTFKIATASMLTPWKGIHTIILFAKLYEKELLSMGMKEISIYGENIYQTSEGLSQYQNELSRLAQGSPLIKFYGQVPTKDIYENCDILIHSSIKPEPFGRIILEAFTSNVLVLSTGLGGAREIFNDNKTLFAPYDFSSLLELVKNYFKDEELLADRLDYQRRRSKEINDEAIEHIQQIFSS